MSDHKPDEYPAISRACSLAQIRLQQQRRSSAAAAETVADRDQYSTVHDDNDTDYQLKESGRLRADLDELDSFVQSCCVPQVEEVRGEKQSGTP